MKKKLFRTFLVKDNKVTDIEVFDEIELPIDLEKSCKTLTDFDKFCNYTKIKKTKKAYILYRKLIKKAASVGKATPSESVQSENTPTFQF